MIFDSVPFLNERMGNDMKKSKRSTWSVCSETGGQFHRFFHAENRTVLKYLIFSKTSLFSCSLKIIIIFADQTVGL